MEQVCCYDCKYYGVDCDPDDVDVNKPCDAYEQAEMAPGCNCEECGRRVTENEYCGGQSYCCKANVVGEEDMV